MPLSTPPYRAPFWLAGGHAQTMWPVLAPRPPLAYRRELWDTPDGDLIAADWVDGPAGAPVVVLFHGLEGSSGSGYARALMAAARAAGWTGVVPHFRGCGGLDNRLPRAYHSGDSAELDWVLRRLRAAHGGPLLAAGVSLGGNALLKWLGEQGDAAGAVVAAAAAVSAPLDLTAAGAALEKGFSRIYAWHFLTSLRPKALAKIARHGLDCDAAGIRRARTMRAFDDLFTAPLHGFAGVEDYWRRASSKPWLARIAVPTLVLNARNDPFLPQRALPARDEASAAVRLEFPRDGGHVGFTHAEAGRGGAWLAARLLAFLAQAGAVQS